MIPALNRSLLILMFVLLASGCASVKKTTSSVTDAPWTAQKQSGVSEAGITVLGVKLKNSEFDYPMVINSDVEFWVDYFAGRGRVHFQKYLDRSQSFIPFIQPILKENKMPQDLVYLAMIESGFNNHARSKAKAVGPWQFISATGKRYGLMVNWWVDERRDTEKSTMAAVGYLKDLYQMFQSWELAAAAYNAGEAKVAKAIRRYGTKDFWQIAKNRFLRPETRNYVPKIMAAAIVAKNAEQFGFTVNPPLALHEGETLSSSGEVLKVVKEENTSPPPGEEAGTIAQLTPESADATTDSNVVAAALNLRSNLKARPVSTPHVSRNGDLGGEDLVEIELQSPADLLIIARAAGLSYTTVKALNPELQRWCTPPTVKAYTVRLPASAKDRFIAAYNEPHFEREIQFLSQKVRPGDTLQKIARRFGVMADPLVDLNRMRADSRLIVGSRVLLPVPNDRTRSLASLEIYEPRRKSSRAKKRLPADARKNAQI